MESCLRKKNVKALKEEGQGISLIVQMIVGEGVCHTFFFSVLSAKNGVTFFILVVSRINTSMITILDV